MLTSNQVERVVLQHYTKTAQQNNSKIYKVAIYLRLSMKDAAIGGSSYQSMMDMIVQRHKVVLVEVKNVIKTIELIGKM